MGIAKKTDGRYLVGVGVDSVNDYKGSAAYRDIYIQLTSSGATAKSEEYLTFLKDYGFHANASGEPIMPPSVSVWISNNGVTTAVEADDVSIDGNNYTICGIKWNGSAWDYSAAGQGKSDGGLPPYTSADKGKVLTIGDASPVETEVVVVPEQTLTFAEYVTSGGEVTVYLAPLPLDGVTNGVMYTATIDGVEMSSTAAFDQITFGQGQFRIRQESGVSTIPDGWYLNGRSVQAGDSVTFSLKTVQSVTPSVTTVIVPRQAFSLRGNRETEINGDPTGFVVGREYECYYGVGVSKFTGTMTETNGKIGFTVNYQTEYGSRILNVYTRDGAVYCKNNESSDMSYVVYIEVNAFVPKTEPIWGQPSSTLIVNVAADMDTRTMTCDKTAAEIYSADSAVFILSSPVSAKCKVVFCAINPQTNGYVFGIYLMSDIAIFQAETASDYPVNNSQ